MICNPAQKTIALQKLLKQIRTYKTPSLSLSEHDAASHNHLIYKKLTKWCIKNHSIFCQSKLSLSLSLSVHCCLTQIMALQRINKCNFALTDESTFESPNKRGNVACSSVFRTKLHFKFNNY